MAHKNGLSPQEFIRLWEGRFSETFVDPTPDNPHINHTVAFGEISIYLGNFRTKLEEDEWASEFYNEKDVSEFLDALPIAEYFYETKHVKSKYSDFGEKWVIVWLGPGGGLPEWVSND